MADSDGIVIDGMYHEEHALPAFVHHRTEDTTFSRIATLKGETPVIYFYTDQPRRVRVSVDFPTGIWTHWFPAAVRAGRYAGNASAENPLTNGHLGWVANLTPPSPNDRLPPTQPGALWNFARQVPDAATVRMTADTVLLADNKVGPMTPRRVPGSGETERFLFYRGLGKANLPVRFLPEENGGQLTCSEPVRHILVVEVKGGRITCREFPTLALGQTLSKVTQQMRPTSAEALARRMSQNLQQAGLFPAEARALVNTWKSSYFGSDGVRVLFLLPQTWTERFLPMRIAPSPDRLVRVMVGRIEGLTRTREQTVADAVRQFPHEPERSFATLEAQGRYLEPILNRLVRTPSSPEVGEIAARLLQTDYVRSAEPQSGSAAQRFAGLCRELRLTP